MQIAVVTTWFPSAKNPGAGSFIARDVEALAADHEVRVLHLAAPELDDGTRSFWCGSASVARVAADVRTPRGMLRAVPHVRRFIKSADIVHSMAAPALLPFLPVRPRQPWVHTEHWSGVAGLARPGHPLRMLVSRRALSAPDEIVAVSDYLSRQIRVLRSGPISVVGNIVDEATVKASPNCSPLLGEGASRSSSLRLLCVANAISHKGWQVAIDAVGELRAQGIDADLTWLGSGPELGDLRAHGSRFGVHAPGQVTHAEVLNAMERSDVFVLPTISETFSLVTIEALAAGLPVVATGVGAHTEFVTVDSGRVVDRNPTSVAQGILDAAKLEPAAARARGRRLACEYSESRFREKYRTIYERVLSR